MGGGWGVGGGWVGRGGGKLVLYCVLGQAVPILDCCGQEGRGPVLSLGRRFQSLTALGRKAEVLYCVLGQAVPVFDCCGQEGRGPVLCPWAGGSSP